MDWNTCVTPRYCRDNSSVLLTPKGKRRNLLIHRPINWLEANIYGNIIYNMLGKEAYIRYINKWRYFKRKVGTAGKGEAFPKHPPRQKRKDERPMEKEKRTAQAYGFTEDPTQIFDFATHQSIWDTAALEAHPAFRRQPLILLYHSQRWSKHTCFIRKWSKRKYSCLVVIGDDLEFASIPVLPTLLSDVWYRGAYRETFTDYAT